MNNTVQLYMDKNETIKGYPITSPDRVINGDGVTLEELLSSFLKKGLLKGCTINTSTDNTGLHLNINIDNCTIKDGTINKGIFGFNEINSRIIPYLALGHDGIGGSNNYMTFTSYPSVFNPISANYAYTEWAYQFINGKYISLRLNSNGEIELNPDYRVSIGRYYDGNQRRELASVFEKNGNGCVGTYLIEAVNIVTEYLRAQNTLHLESDNGEVGLVLYGGREKAFQPKDTLSGQLQLGTPWGSWKSVFAANTYSSDKVVTSSTKTVIEEEITINNVIDNIEFISTTETDIELQMDVSKLLDTNFVETNDNTEDVFINESDLLKLAILEIKKLKEEIKELKDSNSL